MWPLENLKHSSSNPYVFTEQGIAMLFAVLKSDVAVEVSIKIMNTFFEMRKLTLSFKSEIKLFSRFFVNDMKSLKNHLWGGFLVRVIKIFMECI